MGSDKVFRLSVITIISAFILILVVVYSTNTDKFDALFNRNKTQSDTTADASINASGVQIEQIGDNLHGYMVDSDFFDENEKIPEVIITVDNIQSDVSGNSHNGASNGDAAVASSGGSGFIYNGENIPQYPDGGEVPPTPGVGVGNPPDDSFDDIDSINFEDVAH
ncbi:MAG: hypothetical protein K5900_06675 [Butyrivibrio sp.]|nr:hypothetical protein [Butyrivibrio sp.]